MGTHAAGPGHFKASLLTRMRATNVQVLLWRARLSGESFFFAIHGTGYIVDIKIVGRNVFGILPICGAAAVTFGPCLLGGTCPRAEDPNTPAQFAFGKYAPAVMPTSTYKVNGSLHFVIDKTTFTYRPSPVL